MSTTPTPEAILSPERLAEIQSNSAKAIALQARAPDNHWCQLTEAEADCAALLTDRAAYRKQVADVLRGLRLKSVTGYALSPDVGDAFKRQMNAYIHSAATVLGIDLNETPQTP